MVAIETHYIGPTDTKGSRIVATNGNDARKIISYVSSLTAEQNHARAAKYLHKSMKYMPQSYPLIGGHSKKGMVWVFLDIEHIA